MAQTETGIYSVFVNWKRFKIVFGPLESYKNDWFDLVSAFKKHVSSQETICHVQVEAQILTEKETESVRLYALKVQQLVEERWCNESAANNNLKCKKLSPEDYQND